MRSTFSPSIYPFATRLFPSRVCAGKCYSSDRMSLTPHPVLCLVFTYSLPGFPRPAMIFIEWKPPCLSRANDKRCGPGPQSAVAGTKIPTLPDLTPLQRQNRRHRYSSYAGICMLSSCLILCRTPAAGSQDLHVAIRPIPCRHCTGSALT